MSTVINNGTVVTADHSWKADVLIEGGKIVRVAPGVDGGTVRDAEIFGLFSRPAEPGAS